MKIQSPVLKAILYGGCFTLPFLVLELVNNDIHLNTFPFFLFATLWIFFTFIVILTHSIFRDLRERSLKNYDWLRVLIKAIVIIGIIWISTLILIDQFPCFLGYDNCD